MWHFISHWLLLHQALEGKFSVGKKSSAHPHTNMGKAALNMLTLTCAKDYAKDKILVNCVDTGWVTDMAPGGVGAKAGNESMALVCRCRWQKEEVTMRATRVMVCQ